MQAYKLLQPGSTVQTCVQTQTLRGMETYMDDCIAAVVAAAAAYLGHKYIISTIAQWPLFLELLDEEDAVMSEDRRTYL